MISAHLLAVLGLFRARKRVNMAAGSNDTLGDMLDLENIDQITDEVFMMIKTRKSKKKACSREAILENMNISDTIFDQCIGKLEKDGKIKVTAKAGNMCLRQMILKERTQRKMVKVK